MNIYTRTQDFDLLKYLDDQQAEELLQLSITKPFLAYEYALRYAEPVNSIIMVQQGELEMLDVTGKCVGIVQAGEIAGEECYPDTAKACYALRTRRDSIIRFWDFTALEGFVADKPELASRINAAINDCLCLKIIRITHMGESNAQA